MHLMVNNSLVKHVVYIMLLYYHYYVLFYSLIGPRYGEALFCTYMTFICKCCCSCVPPGGASLPHTSLIAIDLKPDGQIVYKWPPKPLNGGSPLLLPGWSQVVALHQWHQDYSILVPRTSAQTAPGACAEDVMAGSRNVRRPSGTPRAGYKTKWCECALSIWRGVSHIAYVGFGVSSLCTQTR